jgi:hypothetical protein
MEAGKFSFKFSRQTQKNLVGSSKYAYFRFFPKEVKRAIEDESAHAAHMRSFDWRTGISKRGSAVKRAIEHESA